jgi:hypothetical protein
MRANIAVAAIEAALEQAVRIDSKLNRIPFRRQRAVPRPVACAPAHMILRCFGALEEPTGIYPDINQAEKIANGLGGLAKRVAGLLPREPRSLPLCLMACGSIL